MPENKKTAFIAIVGRPSAGKSTLVNKICGQKVAIVSDVPQTTRNAIRGIFNSDRGQLVFIDTPGRHKSQKKLNLKLMDVSGRAAADSDLILYVIDCTRQPGEEEADIAAFLIPNTARTIIAINKTDLAAGSEITVIRKFIAEKIPGFEEKRIFEISAVTGAGLDIMLSFLFDTAGEGEAFYGEEYYTDQGVEFRIAEIIREQAIKRLRQELPHALYVDIADTELTADEKLFARAFIIVERESQKGIVVGAKGAMIKSIRLASLKELHKIFDWKIEIDLRVKTGKDWRQKDRVLRKIIEL